MGRPREKFGAFCHGCPARATGFRVVNHTERQMNASFRAVSAGAWLYQVKFRGWRNNNKKRLFPGKQIGSGTCGTTVPTTQPNRHERTKEMMYMTLTLMAGMISVMFVATAASSIVNMVRENNAAREALVRRAIF
jgi:hypothetical protein